MKTIITLTTIFSFILTYAQSPILDYFTSPSSIPDGAYVKDLNNDLDKFVGTWQYVDGDTELTVVLTKEEQVYNGEYYQDKLKGRYKYIKDGVEIVNTLNNEYFHSIITGVGLWDTNLNKIELSLTDPDKLRASYKLTLIRQFTVSGENLQWNLMQTGYYAGHVPGESPPTAAELDQTIRLPKELILIKQQ